MYGCIVKFLIFSGPLTHWRLCIVWRRLILLLKGSLEFKNKCAPISKTPAKDGVFVQLPYLDRLSLLTHSTMWPYNVANCLHRLRRFRIPSRSCSEIRSTSCPTGRPSGGSRTFPPVPYGECLGRLGVLVFLLDSSLEVQQSNTKPRLLTNAAHGKNMCWIFFGGKLFDPELINHLSVLPYDQKPWSVPLNWSR